MVTLDQFKAMDIRIAKIAACEDHPKADKLYVVTVETGSETKKLVAGVRGYYGKEELLGKQVVIINNLVPATIRGIESSGMILVAKDSERLALLTPEREVKTGSPVS